MNGVTNILTVASGEPFLATIASYIASQNKQNPIILLPNKRSVNTLQAMLAGTSSNLFALGSLHAQHIIPLFVNAPHVQQQLEQITEPSSDELLRAHAQRAIVVAATRQRMPITFQQSVQLADEIVALHDVLGDVESTSDSIIEPMSGFSCAQLLDIAQNLPGISQKTHAMRVLTLWSQHAHALSESQVLFLVGSTASVPLTLQFYQAMAMRKNTHVILPGLDVELTEHAWHDIENSHPLYYSKRLLDSLGVTLQQWQIIGKRRTTIAEQIGNWFSNTPASPTQKASQTIATILPCAHREEEISVIVHQLSQYHAQGETSLVISPDQIFLRQLYEHLHRQGIATDGIGLHASNQHEEVQWCLRLLRYIAQPFDVMNLRICMAHPWWRKRLETSDAAALFDLQDCRNGDRTLASERLRQCGFDESLVALHDHCLEISYVALSMKEWCTKIQQMTEQYLIEVPTSLHQALLQMEALANAYAPMTAEELLILLPEILSTPSPQSEVARVYLLPPAEARFVEADHHIVATAHDDAWPHIPSHCSWLTAKEQMRLGLTVRSHHQSLAAHDIWMCLLQARHIQITYSLREQGGPTQLSRFFKRLIVRGAAHLQPHAEVILAVRAKRRSIYTPLTIDTPRLAGEYKPRNVSVSALSMLIVHPYSFYARYILNLRRLDAYATPMDAKLFGQIAHDVAGHVLTHHHRDAYEKYIRTRLIEEKIPAAKTLFWQARLSNIAAFVAEQRTQYTDMPWLEYPLMHEFEAEGEKIITLHARLDYAIKTEEGLEIIDFKTGAIPSNRSVTQGLNPQLPLYGILWQRTHGAYPDVLGYWKLPQIGKSGEIKTILCDLDDWKNHEKGLQNVLSQYLNDAMMFTPRRSDTSAYNDYDGISRAEEAN